MSFPPVYGGTFSVSQSVTSLPAYTARDRPSTASAVRELTEHVFEISKKKKPWATLKLKSCARASTSLPTYLEGDRITGSVTLDLSNSEKILGVSVLIRGQIVTGPSPRDHYCFLDISTPLWLKGMPNPRDSNAGPSDSKFNGKLSGDYHWPFSISLPKEVTLPDPTRRHGEVRTYKLPQTFLERTTRATVFYELCVHVARSTFRVDNNLHTMFVYVPAIQPNPPSRNRQLAYRQNGPIPGPDLDSEGWYTLPTATILGTVFNARRVKIQCALSLAKPLSYTRGSVIPLSITYLSNDFQALNLVCTPTTTKVCLHRKIRYSEGPSAAEYCVRHDDTPPDFVLEICQAVWWPVDDGQGNGTSRFDGELHLPKGLKPSSNISHFSINYSVVMLPFQVTGFTAQAPPPLILKQEVEIATMFPKGPKPRVYSPPSYEHEAGDNMFIPPARGYI
ncbi:hypothetical protein MSAN_00347200 [Mycena sanguinolenta]|uniref:Arrestin-like N-terminal domain-containing protein n=1 Tax=Mycena sanguinolenta TaxID=230812 RepID=A0A8H6ZBU0_9AGAR|nr:hypothetical protein MSAN_00347200 [Mycena sanguinolenta]